MARSEGFGLDRPGLHRPSAMTLDPDACIECGACDEIAPGMFDRPGRIAINPATLAAMAGCPVGAIHWLEGEADHGDDHREDA